MRLYCLVHRESGEGLWLKEEAAFEMHSFRDAEPQPVIQLNEKKNNEMSRKQPNQTIKISLTTNDP